MNKSAIKISLLFLVMLCGVVVWCYARALSYPPHFDTQNILQAARPQGVWPGISLRQLVNEPRALVSLTFDLNYYFAGADIFWLRFVGIAFHVLNTLLVFVFLQRLFRVVLHSGEMHPLWIYGEAFLGALLFGINPVALYAVAYIAQRYIVIATFFALLALISHLQGLCSGKGRWYYLAALFYFLSLHAKEHTIMLPVVFLLLTVLVRQDFRACLKKQLIPFAFFALIGGHVAFMVKAGIGSVYEPHAVLGVEQIRERLGLSLGAANIHVLSVLNQCWYFFKYLSLWILPLPHELALDLPKPFFMQFWSLPLLVGPVLFITYPLFAFLLLMKRGMRGLVGFALLVPWLLFLTELVTVRFHENFVLYRSYPWMVCLFADIPLFMRILKGGRMIALVRGGLILFVCAFFLLVHDQKIRLFRDPVLLWTDIVQKIDRGDHRIPSAYRSYANLATAYGQAGNIERALENYRISLDLNPDYELALYGMGTALFLIKDYEMATTYLKKAIAANPRFAPAYYRLGVVFMALNQPTEAKRYFQMMEDLNNPGLQDDYNAAIALLQQKKYAEASGLFRKVLAKRPGDVRVLDGLGLSLTLAGEVREGINYLEQAVTGKPGFKEARNNLTMAHHNLAISLAQQGRHAEALMSYNRVIELDSGFARAYYNRANSLLALARYDEALRDYETALKISPNYVQALHNKGVTLLKLGRAGEAVPLFERALQLQPDFAPAITVLKELKTPD